MTTTIYKQLACKQDLARGKGKVTQRRNGRYVVLDRINFSVSYDNLQQAIDAEDLEVGEFCETYEYNEGTGVGGAKYQVVDVDPLLHTINPPMNASNRWLKIIIDDVLLLSQTSAVGDGEANDFQAIQDALDSSAGIIVGESSKTYTTDREILIPGKKTFDGRGALLQSTVTGYQPGSSILSYQSLLRNKNATVVNGSVFDEDIKITNWRLLAGADDATRMAGIQLASTKNARIEDCVIRRRSNISTQVNCIDFHHSNINSLTTNCEMYLESPLATQGACFDFRNSNSMVASEGNILENCYMYKNMPLNDSEFMWINGATGNTNNSKVIGNTFETGPDDGTSSVYTMYPYIPNPGDVSQVNGVIVSGNTFLTYNSPTVSFAILLGIGHDTRYSADQLLIEGNTFEIRTGQVALKCIRAQNNSLVTGNICRVRGGGGVFSAIDADYSDSDNIGFVNNRLEGNYSTAFIGGIVKDNWCESAETFASNCWLVERNQVEECTHNFVKDFNNTGDSMRIVDNKVTMKNATAPDVYPFVWYLDSATTRYIVKGNTVDFVSNGFKILRANTNGNTLSFTGNDIYKRGATDTPAFQLFTNNPVSTDNNTIFDVNLDAIEIGQSYGVVGFLHALGHLTKYTNAVVGTGPMGKIMTDSGELDVEVVLS